MRADEELGAAEAARLRHLENEERIRPALAVFGAFVVLSLVAGIFIFPLPRLAAAAAITVMFAGSIVLTQRLVRRSPHPERWLLTEQTIGVAALCAVLLLTEGLHGPAAPLMAVAAALAGARFRGATLAGVLAVDIGAMLTAAAIGGMSDLSTLYVWMAVLTFIPALAHVLANSERTARAEAVLDPLTGLLNRKALERRAEELEGQACLTGSPVAVIALDLDGFKQINDRLGHDAGDAVLREIAYAMRKSLRGFDLLYRVGGDEFLVLLPGGEEDDAARIAEELRAAVEELGGDCADVTLSLGIATARGTAVDVHRLRADADRAMYTAKSAGRNRVAAGPIAA